MYRNIVLLLVILCAAGGCTSIKPWVSPYERNNLADPIMSFSRDPIASSRTWTTCTSRVTVRAVPKAEQGAVVVAAKRLRLGGARCRAARRVPARARRSFRRIART